MVLEVGERRGTRGFTLVELLVVLAVIALLVGVLLPALASARAAAVDVKCKANLKQAPVAQFAYHQDHAVFTHLWAVGDAEREAGVVSPLGAYLGAAGESGDGLAGAGSVLQCPAVSQNELDALAELVPEGDRASSYGLNPAMRFARWSLSAEANGALSRSSELILMGEQALEPFERLQTADGVTSVWVDDVMPGMATPAFPAAWTRLDAGHDPYRAYRHTSEAKPGANFVMLDGSARRLEHGALDLSGPHWTWWDTQRDLWTAAVVSRGQGPGGCGCP